MAPRDDHREEMPSFRAATAEIEQILEQIEDERGVDIDDLATKVERASTLIRLCFEKLRAAEMEVKKVTEELAEATRDREPVVLDHGDREISNPSDGAGE